MNSISLPALQPLLRKRSEKKGKVCEAAGAEKLLPAWSCVKSRFQSSRTCDKSARISKWKRWKSWAATTSVSSCSQTPPPVACEGVLTPQQHWHELCADGYIQIGNHSPAAAPEVTGPPGPIKISRTACWSAPSGGISLWRDDHSCYFRHIVQDSFSAFYGASWKLTLFFFHLMDEWNKSAHDLNNITVNVEWNATHLKREDCITWRNRMRKENIFLSWFLL